MRTLSATIVLLAWCGVTALGQQTHEVADTAALSRAIRSAQAGDVIRVAPGTYRGGLSAKGLRGEAGRPIVIEGTDPKNPPVIEGGTSGLQLSDCRHVTVRHLRLRGATGNGLNIDDGDTMDHSTAGIVVEHVRVEDVGPKGNTDGIKLSGLRDFIVRDCTVEGWGGNAIDLVGCADGVIERCTVRGKEGFDSHTGPQLKGGTHNITIRHCFFDNAGMRAINAGGSTGLQFFRPRDAAFEAKDLIIEHNTFVGSDAPVAFVGVDGAVFRNNTIVNPKRWVLRILQESRDARFVHCRNVQFERNLIVYQRSVLRTYVNISSGTEPATFRFADNWWYCSDAPNDRPQLPSKEERGVYGKDPQLRQRDGRWLPANPAAATYGAAAAAR